MNETHRQWWNVTSNSWQKFASFLARLRRYFPQALKLLIFILSNPRNIQCYFSNAASKDFHFCFINNRNRSFHTKVILIRQENYAMGSIKTEKTTRIDRGNGKLVKSFIFELTENKLNSISKRSSVDFSNSIRNSNRIETCAVK